MFKKVCLYILYIFVCLILLPTVISLFYNNGNKSTPTFSPTKSLGEEKQQDTAKTLIKVYNPETEEVNEMGFEDYIKGVVAAEMPALFSEEALKAQAVAARTYACKKINTSNGKIDPKEPYNIGQAYMTMDELKQKWGDKFNEYYAKISNAVDSTKGEILVYKDEPIEAVFHSTSAGITESSENVWSVGLPYLVSVDSKQDTEAPDYISEKTISTKEIIAKLQSKYNDLVLTSEKLAKQMQIIERTKAGYVKNIQIGNHIFSGKEIRELFGLRSSDFSITQNGDNITFTTKGYGHGAGMSQYGANFMAEEGSTYEDILKHYYVGVEIKKNNF